MKILENPTLTLHVRLDAAEIPKWQKLSGTDHYGILLGSAMVITPFQYFVDCYYIVLDIFKIRELMKTPDATVEQMTAYAFSRIKLLQMEEW